MSATQNNTLPTLNEHRDEALKIIEDYQSQRITWYESVKLKNLLQKDLTMFVARGVTTAESLLEEAFKAAESSSEETVMGIRWQRIIAQISTNTIDSGDLTTDRDGAVWVCEVKNQKNTTNSSSLPQELRSLRVRMNEISRRRRASNQPVKVALCITRDSNPKDVNRVFRSTSEETKDLDGFEYRYISGEKFWRWLTDYPSEIGLLMPLSDINGSKVVEARTNALKRLTEELQKLLVLNKLTNGIDDLIKLKTLL